MSKQLYEEAIADLKKVKEIAEDNAKRAIVEAVAPRIRELIEKELLGESSEMDEEEKPEPTIDPKTGKPLITGEKSSEEESKKPDEKSEALSFSEVVGSDESVEDVSEPDLNEELDNFAGVDKKLLYVEKMLNKLTDVKNQVNESTTASKISVLNESIDMIYDYVQNHVEDPNVRLGYGLRLKKCLEKLENFQETKMKRNLLGEEKVTIELNLPGVELEDDALEGASVDLVREEEEEGSEAEESEEEDLDLDLGEEPSEGEEEAPSEGEDEGLLEALHLNDDAVVEIDESMLRREIAAMRLIREAEAVPSTDGEAPSADEFDDFGGAEEHDDALDLELSEGYDEAEGHDDDEVLEVVADEEGADATDGGAAANLNELDLDEVMVDESEESESEEDEEGHEDLDEMEGMGQGEDKRALGGRGAHDVEQSQKQPRQPAAESVRSQMASELKVQESLRTRASQLKKLYESYKKSSVGAQTLLERKEAATRSDEIKAAYVKTAERYNASVKLFNKLSQSLSEGAEKNSKRSNNDAKSAASTDQVNMLSKKLAETNLFNAKLLFTNKLLQTESLTARQKAQVIEQLDAAETIREAKLVYESLAKALVKPRKTVTEGRVLGSSSRATRPASTQTLNEGVEAERWARLAGIK